MSLGTINQYRTKRGRALSQLLETTAHRLGRKLKVLDVGGRPDYWQNVGYANIESIELLNYDAGEFDRQIPADAPPSFFSYRVADACNLSDIADQSVDFIHSNSVIEHVGDWTRMVAMAREAQRIGRAGWIQTPAWEFPIEPHYRLPFMHWFGRPMQSWLVYYSPPWRGRRNDLYIRRLRVERINLVSKGEFRELFPGKEIYVERVALLPKSYCAHWTIPTTEPASSS